MIYRKRNSLEAMHHPVQVSDHDNAAVGVVEVEETVVQSVKVGVVRKIRRSICKSLLQQSTESNHALKYRHSGSKSLNPSHIKNRETARPMWMKSFLRA